MADPEIVGGGCGRSRAAEGREWVGCGEWYPLPTIEVWGGAVPPPQKMFFNFGPQNGQFRCTVGAGGVHPPSPSGSATGQT